MTKVEQRKLINNNIFTEVRLCEDEEIQLYVLSKTNYIKAKILSFFTGEYIKYVSPKKANIVYKIKEEKK